MLDLPFPTKYSYRKVGREKNEKLRVIRCSALQGQVITRELEN